MAINAVNGIGWQGWVPQNPRVNTILTPDSLETIMAAGYLSQDDPLVFPQLIHSTDLWDIEYDYNPVTGTQTYTRFVTTIDSNGVITISPSLSITSFTPTNPDLAQVASVTPGTYTIGNFLVAADIAGTIRAGNGTTVTQTLSNSTSSGNTISGIFTTSLTNTNFTAGNSYGLEAAMNMVGGSGGTVFGMQAQGIATGTLASGFICGGSRSVMALPATVINSAQVTAGIDAFGSSADNPSGTLTNCSVRRFENNTSATIGQMFDIFGSATYAFRMNTNATPGYVSAAGGPTPGGTMKNVAILLNGVVGYMLVSGTPY